MLPGVVPRSPMITHPAWFVAEAWNSTRARPNGLRVASEKKRSSVSGVFVRFSAGLNPATGCWTAQNTSPKPMPVITPGRPASAVGSTCASVKRRNATYVSRPFSLKPTCGQSTLSVLNPGIGPARPRSMSSK
jgi:hypothetical protein